MVDFILFQGWSLHQAVPQRCHFTLLYSSRLALIGGHSYSLGSCPALRCITIKDVDVVPTLEEYDRFLSLPTLVSQVYQPPTRPHFCKRLVELLGLKTPVVDVLTQYGSDLGGSIPWDFLICQFGEVKCPATYRRDFMDLEEHWTFYRRLAFMVAFFGSVLFHSQSVSISFVVLPLVSTLPHSISFIPSPFSETI